MTKTCEERISENLNGRIDDLRLLWAGYCGESCPNCDDGEIESENGEWVECLICGGSGIAPEDVPDLGHIYDYGLSFDYVPPNTFEDQNEGYFRYQLSYGGPQDEFRIYCQFNPIDRSVHIYKIEYWFLDWVDGAKRILSGSDYELVSEIFVDLFVDTGTALQAFEDAMEEALIK